jgi:hypothetical protein
MILKIGFPSCQAVPLYFFMTQMFVKESLESLSLSKNCAILTLPLNLCMVMACLSLVSVEIKILSLTICSK